MKRSIFTLLILAFVCACQLKAQTDYIIFNDTLVSYGVKLEDKGGYARYHEVTEIISRKKSQGIRVYTPDSLKGYYMGGKEYESWGIELNGATKQVFLEKILSHNPFIVWLYKGKEGTKYFLQKDNQLLVMSSDEFYFKQILETESASKNLLIRQQVEKMRLNSYSMKRAHKAVVTDNRNLYERFRWGVLVGGGLNVLKLDESINDYHFFMGAFINQPLHYNLSLQLEATYRKEAYSGSIEKTSSIKDIIYNRQGIQIPILLRYSFNYASQKCIPYLQAGPSIYFTFKNKLEERLYSIVDGIVNSPEDSTYKPSKIAYGITAGTGMEIRITDKHSLFADLRYLYQKNSCKGYDAINEHQFNISLSVNF